jgi:Flp pilus assembly protein CpaB
MRKGRIFFFIALILILGLGAVAIFYYQGLQPATPEVVAETEPAPVVDVVEVVIVAQHVPRGYMLNETVLGVIDIPSFQRQDR